MRGCFACSSTETTFVDEPDEAKARRTRASTPKPSAESGLGVLTFMPETSLFGLRRHAHAFIVPVARLRLRATISQVTADNPPLRSTSLPKTLTNPVHVDGTTDSGKYYLRHGEEGGHGSSSPRSRTEERRVHDHGRAVLAASRWTAGETRYKNGGGGDPPCTDCHVNGKAIDHFAGRARDGDGRRRSSGSPSRRASRRAASRSRSTTSRSARRGT